MELRKKIILGSASPRRKSLLEQMGIVFETRVMETDESFPSHLEAGDIPEYLALQKGNVQKHLLQENEILITADTIVWHHQNVYNKPADAAEAFDMLSRLSGESHEVYTAIALTGKDEQISACDRTEVRFRELSPEEIHYYIQHYAPFDKAGAYGAQDWLGLTAITSLRGSYFTVMGLPTHLLYRLLQPYIHI
jgi:septum formation protein